MSMAMVTNKWRTDCDDTNVDSTNQSQDSDCDGMNDFCFLTNCDMSVDMGDGADFVLIDELDDPSGRYSLSNNLYDDYWSHPRHVEEVMGYDSRTGVNSLETAIIILPIMSWIWLHTLQTHLVQMKRTSCYACTGSGTSVTRSEAMNYLCTGYSQQNMNGNFGRSGTTSEFWTGKG